MDGKATVAKHSPDSRSSSMPDLSSTNSQASGSRVSEEPEVTIAAVLKVLQESFAACSSGASEELKATVEAAFKALQELFEVSASRASEEPKFTVEAALKILQESPEFVVLNRLKYFLNVHGFGNRSMAFKNLENHSYGHDTLILSAFCATISSSPHDIAIAVLPQDTLHAHKLNHLDDQIPDFTVLGWFGGDNPSHAESSHLFFLWEKKTEPDKKPANKKSAGLEWSSVPNLRQLGKQALLAFQQYDVASVYVVLAVTSQFTLLQYRLSEDLTDVMWEDLQWYSIVPTPICVNMPLMKNPTNFSDGLLWALRLMAKVVDAPRPGGTFSTQFQRSWFEPTSEADFSLRGPALEEAISEIENALATVDFDNEKTGGEQLAKEDNSEEDEDDDEDDGRNAEHDHIHGSAKRMARFPDVTFVPTEELRQGEGERSRSSGSSDDWLPVPVPIKTRAVPKRRRGQ